MDRFPHMAALTATTVLLVAARCGPLPGDANLDGAVDRDDVDRVLACLGVDPQAGLFCLGADTNRDGAISLADRDFVVSYLPDLLCNGDPVVCDRPYDEVAYATTHNAFSALDDGFDPLVANHTRGMREQLAEGVRGLMLDTHYFEGGTKLCHAYCQLGGQGLGQIDLAVGLGWIASFLDENPDAIVTIIFESYISEADTAAAFAASGLQRYVHEQTPGEPWPTLREMIRAGRRLVVLTDDGSASLPWHHYVWDFAFETDFDFSLFDDPLEVLVDRLLSIDGCADNRGTPGADLFILNHFITATAGTPIAAAEVNGDPELRDRATLCGQYHGQIPNFVTVDYYEIGDLLGAVDYLNATF
jgi:hypothetical protein